MPDPFAVLRERLLRAGVRPRTVSRYVSELREHLDDLTLELEAEGFPIEDARQRAYSRLGSIDTLALPMISDRRFHSWAARTPWAVFVLAPVVGYGLIVALLTLALGSAVLTVTPGADRGEYAITLQGELGTILDWIERTGKPGYRPIPDSALSRLSASVKTRA